MSGLYIHIPFCASRCVYCDFYSTTDMSFRDRYVDCLCREMNMRKSFFLSCKSGKGDETLADTTLRTVYIGGGTPSQLSADSIERLTRQVRDAFETDLKEVTIEANPDDVSPEMVEAFRRAGVNRVSMGVQTFDDRRLKFLRRRHDSEQAVKAIDVLGNGGIGNISIDLMFGFPGQTLGEWRSDIQQALSLGVRHISAYSLTYEPGTPLYKMREAGRIRSLDDDACADMYQLLCSMMREAGFEHYEISNFARKGFRSLHNSIYWHDEPYLGIGAAAHSYNLKTRQWNVADIQAYMRSIESGTLPNTVESIDAATHYNNLVTTALRTVDGLDLSKLFPKQREYALKMSRKYIDNGMMSLDGCRLTIMQRGLFLCDMIMRDLMIV